MITLKIFNYLKNLTCIIIVNQLSGIYFSEISQSGFISTKRPLYCTIFKFKPSASIEFLIGVTKLIPASV